MISAIKNYMRGRRKFVELSQINFHVETYRPDINRFKQLALLGFVGFLFITPCTNWLLIPMAKLLNKFPLWIYQ